MKSSNPILGKKVFDRAFDTTGSETMTIQGTINKVAIMFLMVLLSASFVWSKFFSIEGETAASSIIGYVALGGIGGFIVALIASFNMKNSAIWAPIYAILEGLFLGGISAIFESMYPGLVMRAVMLTFAVMFALLFLYKSRIIVVTEKFRTMVVAATIGIAVAYLFSFILGLFGVNMGFMYGGGMIGIIISLVIVGVAAMNLVLDFDFIEQGANSGMPKYMEWYGAFGLMVTLVWLYLEILRLLSLLSGRD